VLIAVMVAAVMAVTAVLVLGRDGERRASDEDRAARRGPPSVVLFRSPRLGVVGARPRSWHLGRLRSAIRLRSPDRSSLVAIAAAPPRITPRRLLSSTLQALDRSYSRVRISRSRSALVGNLRGRALRAFGVNSRGVRLDVLVATAKGRRRTYLLQVFTSRGAPRRRVAQGQTIVTSLELRG